MTKGTKTAIIVTGVGGSLLLAFYFIYLANETTAKASAAALAAAKSGGNVSPGATPPASGQSPVISPDNGNTAASGSIFSLNPSDNPLFAWIGNSSGDTNSGDIIPDSGGTNYQTPQQQAQTNAYLGTDFGNTTPSSVGENPLFNPANFAGSPTAPLQADSSNIVTDPTGFTNF